MRALNKILNNFYGEGGTGSKVDTMICNYAKKLGYLNSDEFHNSIFRIHVDTAQKRKYPSFDRFYVNFKTREIASNEPDHEKGWISMYGARP